MNDEVFYFNGLKMRITGQSGNMYRVFVYAPNMYYDWLPKEEVDKNKLTLSNSADRVSVF